MYAQTQLRRSEGKELFLSSPLMDPEDPHSGHQVSEPSYQSQTSLKYTKSGALQYVLRFITAGRKTCILVIVKTS